VILWLRKAWAWTKKYWKYLLFPVGILVGIIGMLIGKKKDLGDVVAPKEVETESERNRANEQARREAEEAQRARDQKVKELEEQHAETLEKLTEKQKERVEELREDPDKHNEFLLQVGKEVRGG